MSKMLMFTRFAVGAAVLALMVLAAARDAQACGDYLDEEMREFRDAAIGADPIAAKDAIEILRTRGYEGVYALSNAHHLTSFYLKRARANPETPEARIAELEAQLARTSAALDKVAGQKDAHIARLYWFTDLDAAKKEAAKRKMPILSLRLLGRLDEDLSCANSRYFRTVLYADERVHHRLRSHFVLHWESIRPVPVMTIDFGDGRTVCRTITGNSIHYVLDARGRPVDAIPGLYGAAAFRSAIDGAHTLEAGLRALKPDARALRLAVHHGAAGARLDRAFAEDLERIGDARGRRLLTAAAARARTSAVVNGPAPERREAPSARRAAAVAVGKSMAELPAVRAAQPDVGDVRADATRETWNAIAALPGHADQLGSASLALMRSKVPPMANERFARMAAAFRTAVLRDTVRNEYDLHRTIHTWFSKSQVRDVDGLNERVYDELFLTPSSDPWLGLVPADAYSALDGGGLRTANASDAAPDAHASTSR